MDELLTELKQCYGPNAGFREGQEEVIRGVLEGKRTLVVQKTGWGKSLVYFLAAKILRKRTKGITLIVSPLLALMDNQIDSANRLGLCVETINSNNTEQWDDIGERLNENRVDALIISPERFSNDDFKRMLSEKIAAQIVLFVVDEAHCISDWGHDFRPDYRRIIDIVNMLPSNVPVLATTATANDRVIRDIRNQLGDDLLINRGGLMRESLAIQVIRLNTKEERLAWILDNIGKMPGTGIIYCLTTRDCRLLNRWLQESGIESEAYYADIDKVEQKDKKTIESKFANNEIKVLIATVAFGMGYDKPDIGFVIHFQKPGNIVAYYQQIGRAGRAIEQAYAVLLCGEEDDEINRYFIESAFPTEDRMNDVINAMIDRPGMVLSEIEQYVNMKHKKIENCLKYLLVNGDIYKEKNFYYKTPRKWQPDLDKSREITGIRMKELEQMNGFSRISGCYMEFIAKVLDDDTAVSCGRCANCLGHELYPAKTLPEMVMKAQKFMQEDFNIIIPRKKWPFKVSIEDKNKIEDIYLCGEGRVLSNYGDAGWGKAVTEGKYKQNYFADELVEESYKLLNEFVRLNEIRWVTNIASAERPELVKSFAKRLAKRLGLPYVDTIEKRKGGRYQKELNTGYLQFKNAYDSFNIRNVVCENVLLVDDMVDSRWTFTVCGYKLRKLGCGKVYPFALANSAGRNGDEGRTGSKGMEA